jgi:hypothetical protein
MYDATGTDLTHESRGESTQLKEQLVDFKAKAKHWIAQSRITSSAEVKIILTKVDAAYNQIAQLEKSLAEAHKQIKGLHSGKRDLMAQMGLMVPVSELHAAKAESSKLRETIDGLSQLLRSTQAEAEKQSSAVQVRVRVQIQTCSDPLIAGRFRSLMCLRCAVQGMVSRSELLAAQSEARANKEEIQAKLGELSRMQSQLNDARYEAAQLKAAMSGMITRAEVEQEKQHWQEVEAALKDDLQNARLASQSLNEKIGLLEGEKSKLVAKIQVPLSENSSHGYSFEM